MNDNPFGSEEAISLVLFKDGSNIAIFFKDINHMVKVKMDFV